jgi:hypothetical protein
LIAFKEDRLLKLLEKLHGARTDISQLCGSDPFNCFSEVILSLPLSSNEESHIDEALKEAHWRAKIDQAIPQGLKQEIKRLEAVIRQDL